MWNKAAFTQLSLPSNKLAQAEAVACQYFVTRVEDTIAERKPNDQHYNLSMNDVRLEPDLWRATITG